MSKTTTYEAIDGRIAPESITEDTMSGLEIVDGHAVKAPGDYEDPDRLIFGVFGAIVFGVGMCMTMIWGMMIPGIAVGIVGIVLLICLIPLVKGLK